MAIGYARAEKISGECPVNSGAKNIIGVIAAEIGDCAEPVIYIIGERCAATFMLKLSIPEVAGFART